MPISTQLETIIIRRSLQICESRFESPFDGMGKTFTVIVDEQKQSDEGDEIGKSGFEKTFPLTDLFSLDGGADKFAWLTNTLNTQLLPGETLVRVSFGTPREGLGFANMVILRKDGTNHEKEVPIQTLLTIPGAQDFYVWLKAVLYNRLCKELGITPE